MERPKVGVGVILSNRAGKFLLGRRLNAHGEGTWSFPGGHLENGESLVNCAIREVDEEAGLDAILLGVNPVAVTNDIFAKGTHYITLFMSATYESGEPAIMEPSKCAEWKLLEWFRIQEMMENHPEKLFLPAYNLLKQGYSPLDPKWLPR